MKTKRNKAARNITQFSSREEMLRTLALGGVQGSYGFGYYPERVFASGRYMTFVRAVR